jgi:Spy/CpxP family protein refolding chaperone
VSCTKIRIRTIMSMDIEKTKPRIRHAKVVLPILAIGLALTGSTAYAAATTTNPNGLLHRFGIELTDEQKDAMDEIRQLRANGQDDEAAALAESVGLPANGPGPRGGGEHGMGMGGPGNADHEAMQTALENNDYAAFVTATADAPFADQVDEAFFAKMVEAHTLRQAGDNEGADAIMEELGMGPRGGHDEHGMGMGGPGNADHEAMQTALENNDYAAFVTATADAPFADQVDEAFFAKMVEAHTLRQAGDNEGADAIMSELGLPQPGPREGHGPRHNGGMFLKNADLTDAQQAQLEEARTLFQNGDREAAKAILDQVRAEVISSTN